MLPLYLLLLLAASRSPAARAATCPHPVILSCTAEARSSIVDPCCTLAPGGLVIFRQRFEPDVGSDAGSWGIDGIEVLEWVYGSREDVPALFGKIQSGAGAAGSGGEPTIGPLVPARPALSSRSYSHEEVASLCLKSSEFGGEDAFVRAEGDWAQSEVGEGVEELWERSWNAAGRYISTLAPSCLKDSPKGSEVPLYFNALHKLHDQFSPANLLADADITPSSDTTYSLEEVIGALSIAEHRPVVACNNQTLSTVSWPLQVQGMFQHGVFLPSKSWTKSSSCPDEGILYPPSTTVPKPTAAPTWDPIHRPAPRPITKTHDESRLYRPPPGAAEPDRQDPKRLGFFKGSDQERESAGEVRADKQFSRDEL